jgi:hypothetical protein
MRYAIGLSLMGFGGLLIYGGFTDQSVWGMVQSAITGQTYEPRAPAPNLSTGTPRTSDRTTYDNLPIGTLPPTGTDPLGNGDRVV